MPTPSQLVARLPVQLRRGPRKGRWPSRTLPAFPVRSRHPTKECGARPSLHECQARPGTAAYCRSPMSTQLLDTGSPGEVPRFGPLQPQSWHPEGLDAMVQAERQKTDIADNRGTKAETNLTSNDADVFGLGCAVAMLGIHQGDPIFDAPRQIFVG